MASATDMSYMFAGAQALNRDISGWNVLKMNTADWADTWTSTTALSGCSSGASGSMHGGAQPNCKTDPDGPV